jgi:hypothetical protein
LPDGSVGVENMLRAERLKRFEIRFPLGTRDYFEDHGILSYKYIYLGETQTFRRNKSPPYL